MLNINLKSLIDKMSPVLRDALEGAAGLCLAHTQYNVEIEHWLLKLLDNSDTDFFSLLEKHEVNPSHLAKQLANSIAKFKNGSSRPAALSPAIVDAAKSAWMLASVDYGHGQMTSGHLLAAVLLDEQLRRQLLESCPELKSVAPESIRETARALIGTTGESSAGVTAAGLTPADPASIAASNAPALDKFTINLTERAKNGEIDPVLGRDDEIRQCIDILTRRRQNNPIFTGEAGVGKTAVVEGFALRIANDDVPDPLKGVVLRTLDLGLLQAGASVKGEFENRLKSVIEEVKASPVPIILFIDEAHTLIGAGGKEGQGDAANLLKPALARGELRTIAATTWAEYKKYFERDPALTRRFQVIKIEEPDEEKAIDMMRGIAGSLQSHHTVRILDEAIIASVQLSHRYIPGRQLPDKSVSLLDTACARVGLSLTATPAPVEDARRRITLAESTITMLERENAASGAHDARLIEMKQEKEAEQGRLALLEQQWEQEKGLIDQIRDILVQIDEDYHKEDDKMEPDALTDLKQKLQTLHFLVSLSLISFWFLERSEFRSLRHTLLFFGAMGLAAITKGPVGFLLPWLTVLAYLGFSGRLRELKRLRWAAGLSMFMAAALPWFLAVSWENPDFPRYAFWNESLMRFTTGSARRSGPLYYYLPVFIFGFLPWSLFLVAGYAGRLRA